MADLANTCDATVTCPGDRSDCMDGAARTFQHRPDASLSRSGRLGAWLVVLNRRRPEQSRDPVNTVSANCIGVMDASRYLSTMAPVLDGVVSIQRFVTEEKQDMEKRDKVGTQYGDTG